MPFNLNKILFITCFLLLSNLGIAQDTTFQIVEEKASQIKGLAKSAEKTGSAYIALKYYKELVVLKPEKDLYLLKLAELYMYTRNYAEAAKCFKEIVDKSGEGKDAKYPDALFYWAVMQKQIGDYEGAKANLLKFKDVARRASAPELSILYKEELAGCDLAISYRDSSENAVVVHLPGSINNPHIDFSPIPLTQNKIVFGSLREDQENYYYLDSIDSLTLPIRKFYVAEKVNDVWEYKGEWKGPFNSPDEDVANGTFSLDSSRFYFSRCAEDWKYKVNCKIYFSEKNEAEWGEPELMGKQVNMPGSTSSHPTVGRDSETKQEVIYFISDRPGGKGGTDIWYTEHNDENEKFTTPSNAGDNINSIGSEMTPYYNVKTKTLYYSTNGKPSFGGLDIFKAVGERNKFEPSINMGIPINSKEDDLDFILYPNSKGGYFVSNREGGQSLYNATCCDDIYEFMYNDVIELNYCGNIIDKETLNCVDSKTKLKIYIVDEAGQFLSQETDVSDCKFNVKLYPGFNYLIQTITGGYLNGKVRVSTLNLQKSDSICEDIIVEKIPTGRVALKNIYYDFDSPNLTDIARNSIDTTLLVILIDNPDIVVLIASHTDSKGDDAYNVKLSQKRAESVVQYLIKKGIKIERLQAKGYGETIPIAENTNADGSDNPVGRQRNRRTEFKILGKLDQELFHDDGFDDIDKEE